MNQKVKLSKKQEEIVYSTEDALCVKASAGSGKTRILTERIRYLLSKTKRKILALTFTNKAAEEMKNRLSETVDVNNRLFVGTFHSFCQMTLENHGNLIGLAKMPHIFEEEGDRLKLVEQAIEETPIFGSNYNAKSQKEKRVFSYKVLEFISQAKRELMSEEDLLAKSNENTVILYRTYQEILVSQNAIDFDDLFLLVCNLFTSYPKIAALYRRTYEYICIDEAQDLNNAQYQVLLSLTAKEHTKILMVGDPNQSIFLFVGSSAEFMTKNFIEDFNPKVYELKENFRSAKKILKVAEKIIPSLTDLNNTEIEGRIELREFLNEELEAEWVTSTVKELINLKYSDVIEGEITFEKIAILARNKYVFKDIENFFKNNGMPYYYKMTPGNVKFESRLIKILDLALKIKLNAKDSLHWNKLMELLKIKTQKNIDLKSVLIELNDGLEKQVILLINDLAEDGSNLLKYLKNLKISVENDNFEEDDEKRMIINDIDELIIHWRNYAKRSEKRSLHQFKNRMALGQTHPLAQHSGITLSTVHTMKGQEFDIVFLIGMDNGTFPDYRAINKGGFELTQEKNNTYVAVTRAKRFLYITYPKNRKMPWGDYKPRNISMFLKDIDQDEI